MQVQVALPLPVDTLFTYSVPEPLRAQVRSGQQVLVPFRGGKLKGVVMGPASEPAPPNRAGKGVAVRDILCVLSQQEVLPPACLDLARWIAREYGASVGEAVTLFSPSFRKTKRERKPAQLQSEAPAAPPSGVPADLSDEQRVAAAAVQAAVAGGAFQPFLLFGVTASGKTEVYLRAIQTLLDRNRLLPPGERRGALFLVPEISLCPPFYEILRSRLGERVALWHSQVPPPARAQFARELRAGRLDVIVGARSALFAPLARVGLIVLDEEHDASYKQEEKPRYHAREVALELARLHGACVILGSATPAVETFYRARRGEIGLLTLSARVTRQSLPEVRVVDRKLKVVKDAETRARRLSPLTAELSQAVNVALARREQVILALNRRGFSTYLLCPACGRVWKCPDCNLTLVHHRDAGGAGDRLRCHACFYESDVPPSCPQCASGSLLLGGFGTQKIVQEVKAEFPHARVLRLDRDNAGKKDAHGQTYRAFRSESADILVGTQMVTQGFDFPRVTVVGIVDADTALYQSDFRAAERAFQWVSQAAGRSGRGSLGGKVVVQTSVPEHYALEAACRHDYVRFYEREIEFRRALSYPPFSRLVLFRVQSGAEKERVEPESERLAAALRAHPALRGASILGPGPLPRETLKKQVRWQVLVKCLERGQTEAAARAGRAFVPKPGVRVAVDVDPMSLL